MKTYWNTKFTKRDYECTNIVAIKAEKLPKGYDPEIWKATGPEARAVTKKVCTTFDYLGTVYQNGERFEQYGYL